MKRILFILFVIISVSTFGQLEQFDDAPRKKREKDTIRYRHFAIEASISEIFMAGINMGFALRANNNYELDINGTYLFGYNHARDRTIRINNNLYFPIKKNIKPFVSLGCGLGREEYSYIVHSTSTSGSGYTFHFANTYYKYAFRQFLSLGIGVALNQGRNYYYKTRFSYSYNISHEKYFLPRVDFSIGYRL